jgi:hypothetical protein
MIQRDKHGLKSDSGGPITEQEYNQYLKWGLKGPPASQPVDHAPLGSQPRPHLTEKDVKKVEGFVRIAFGLLDIYLKRKGGVFVRRHWRKGKPIRKYKRKYPHL